MAKSDERGGDQGRSIADQVAEFIGKSLGELMNRKDALQKQLAAVDDEIASIRSRVMSQFAERASPATRRGRPPASKKAPAGEARRGKRQLSEETRAKMAAAARKRWAKIKKTAKA